MKRFLPVLFFAAVCAATSWAGTESDVSGDASETIQPKPDVETQSPRTARPGASRRRQKQSIENSVRHLISQVMQRLGRIEEIEPLDRGVESCCASALPRKRRT